MRLAFAFLLALTTAAAAQRGPVAPGPVSTFTINEYGLATGSPGYNTLTGKTAVSCALAAEKTLVFLVIGQSLSANANGSTIYTPTNAAKVNQLNIYDGLCYQLKGPALGVSGTTQDVIWSRLGDNLINASLAARVIFVPIGISSSSSYDWSVGPLYSRIMVAANRMRAAGLTPTAVLWQQGQGDVAAGSQSGATTTSATYQANVKQAQNILKGSGFDLPWLIAVDTMISNATDATISGAQSALVNSGENRFAGPSIDGLTGANRLGDGTHLSDTGLAAAATTGTTGWQTAIANRSF